MKNFHLPLPEQTWSGLRAEAERGRRPVIVVSHDGFNRTPGWKSIIVVPISTSPSQSRRGPTVVELPGGSTGLPKASFAMCQVTTLDRAKLARKVGTLSSEVLRSVGEALKASMDLD